MLDSLTLLIAYAVIGGTLIVIIFIGLRGVGILGAKENPNRILGKTVRITDVEGLGHEPVELPPGVVSNFEDGVYRIDFAEPASIGGGSARSAMISARHKGYPVSKMGVVVAGTLDTGQAFLGGIRHDA